MLHISATFRSHSGDATYQKDAQMTQFWKRFTEDTSGAVTVDWVVLTAAVVGLGLGAASSIAGGATDMSDNLGSHLSSAEIFVQND
jgi:Flp pilus assembly pilin Flp